MQCMEDKAARHNLGNTQAAKPTKSHALSTARHPHLFGMGATAHKKCFVCGDTKRHIYVNYHQPMQQANQEAKPSLIQQAMQQGCRATGREGSLTPPAPPPLSSNTSYT